MKLSNYQLRDRVAGVAGRLQDGCRAAATRFLMIHSKFNSGDRNVCTFVSNLRIWGFQHKCPILTYIKKHTLNSNKEYTKLPKASKLHPIYLFHHPKGALAIDLHETSLHFSAENDSLYSRMQKRPNLHL